MPLQPRPLAWIRSALIVLGLTCASLSSPARAGVLQLEHYLTWQRVASAQISPDGRTILYSIASNNGQADRIDEDLWVMDARGNGKRKLGAGRGAVWSPDSTRIAYLDAGNIFIKNLSDDATLQLTRGEVRPSDLSWSPDGQWLAFRSLVPEPAWSVTLPRPADAKWTDDPLVTDRLQFRSAAGVRNGYKHIFVIAASGGSPRQLTAGRFEVGGYYTVVDRSPGLAWTPDSKAILFSANMEGDADRQFRRSALHAVDVVTGTSRKISRSDGFWLQPAASPDGRKVAYWGTTLSTVAYPPHQIRVSSLDGSAEQTLIADLPGDIYFLQWARDGRGLYYVTEKEGSRNLHHVSLDGKLRNITTAKQILSISFISNSGTVAATRTTPMQPEEIVRFDIRHGNEHEQLTALNAEVLQDVELGRVEEVWYPSADGTRVQGWIMYPPGFDAAKRYPLVLYIHGGPHMMYDVAFSFRFQEMAANGYVLMYVNPRGSTGYGSTFANMIDNAYPGPDLPDLLGGIDLIATRGFIDSQRLYVTGCSGGGALTNRLVAHTNRFAAAASLCSVSNWISMLGTGDTKLWPLATIRPSPWQDSRHWLELSPLMHADKVKTPTLLITGQDDVRTPPGQAEEFYTALKLHDVPTRLVLLKNQAHGWPAIPSNFMRSQLYTRKWFSEWKRVENGNEASWTAP